MTKSPPLRLSFYARNDYSMPRQEWTKALGTLFR